MSHAAFARFGPEHLAALAIIAIATVAVSAVARRSGEAGRRILRGSLAAVMLSLAAVEVWRGLARGLPLEEVLPLQLCDLSLMLGALALLTLSARVVEPLYFFAMSGTLIALLTPELPCLRLTDFRFVSYFGLHGLTIVAAVAAIFAFGLVPRRGAWWRAFLWLNGWTALVALVNLVARTNFMYLRAKPSVPTLFDALGPWPWYLLSLELVALLLFLALDAALGLLRLRPAEA